MSKQRQHSSNAKHFAGRDRNKKRERKRTKELKTECSCNTLERQLTTQKHVCKFYSCIVYSRNNNISWGSEMKSTSFFSVRFFSFFFLFLTMKEKPEINAIHILDWRCMGALNMECLRNKSNNFFFLSLSLRVYFVVVVNIIWMSLMLGEPSAL